MQSQKKKKIQWIYKDLYTEDSLTLLCDLDLPSAKLGLFYVLDTEVTATFGVDLSLLSRRCLIIWAVCVWGSYGISTQEQNVSW